MSHWLMWPPVLSVIFSWDWAIGDDTILSDQRKAFSLQYNALAAIETPKVG
jgi:hypothetical protein